jgi:hypothetical protein
MKALSDNLSDLLDVQLPLPLLHVHALRRITFRIYPLPTLRSEDPKPAAFVPDRRARLQP